MSKIDAHARNLRELLGGKRYFVDTFQREYRWKSEQIDALVADLTGAFLRAWRPDHPRSEGEKYPSYFLGSVIISGEEARGSVIDGQQRLTSLTLMLIWVFRKLPVTMTRTEWERLIFTESYGQKSFALDVPERTAALEGLLADGDVTIESETPESVKNIVGRFADIDEAMPEALKTEPGLISFADWLINNVYLVEIRTKADDEAYAIFETMNDRGLALSETDMLKGYLLSRIPASAARDRLNALWKKRINELIAIDQREEAIRNKEGEAIKAWLRAQHAATIRLREKDARPGDFDRIGTELHRWVKDKAEDLKLSDGAACERFIQRDFDFYTGWYLRLRRAADKPQPGLEPIFCNADIKFTLQYPLMLAPIRLDDDEATAWRKAKVVATFIDILINRRVWNGRGVDYNTMSYAMFETVLKNIRGRSAAECAAFFADYLQKEKEAPPFAQNPTFGLLAVHKKTMRRYLARMAAWLDVQAGTDQAEAPLLTRYLVTMGKSAYDIEHIIPDTFGTDSAGYASALDFREGRNRIGGLLLLPKSVNRSLNDDPYVQKRGKYGTQNTLAKTLEPTAYQNDPQFNRVVSEFGFRHLDAFTRSEAEERQAVYARLADRIWSPERLWREAGVAAPVPAATAEAAE